jgi:hypothetical protein
VHGKASSNQPHPGSKKRGNRKHMHPPA